MTSSTQPAHTAREYLDQLDAHVAQDLRAAADILKRDGWTQGAYYDDTGCHCAMGAIATALNVISTEPGDLTEAEWERWSDDVDHLAKHLGDDVDSWNDAPGRTADEVIAALHLAADAAEALQ